MKKRAHGGTAAAAEQLEDLFVSRWNRLVSTTNWEKGRIICEWRDDLAGGGAEAGQYSDETWSRMVGAVSSQHVGRLRRVYRRFDESRGQYPGLYWSHFQAALDWNDAEMWLEGAVASGWSVSQMRRQRWEALGAPEELKPRDEDIIVSELDEDVDVSIDAAAATLGSAVQQVRPAAGAVESDEVAEDEEAGAATGDPASSATDESSSQQPSEAARERRVQPFAGLPALPDDLTEAFEAFKLAILRHKTSGWREVAADDVIATLEALRELALAP